MYVLEVCPSYSARPFTANLDLTQCFPSSVSFVFTHKSCKFNRQWLKDIYGLIVTVGSDTLNVVDLYSCDCCRFISRFSVGQVLSIMS